MKANQLKQKLHRLLAIPLVAMVLALQGLLGPLRMAQANDAAYGITHRDILGDAINYGIVTQEFSLVSGDAQSNVAAQVGTSKTQTGNDLTNPVEQPFVLARVPDEFRIKGFDAYVLTNAGDAHKIVGTGSTRVTLDTSRSADELHDYVGSMLNHGADQSAWLASLEPNAQIVYNEASQKYELDTTGLGHGTFVVDVDDEAYEAISRESSKLRIFKDEGQTIVFNVFANAQRMQKYDINGRGADSFLDGNAGTMPQTIVWNLPNATNLTIEGSITGIVLAPLAAVTVHATSSGWLMAPTVVIGNGEWHNVNQEVEPIRPDVPVVPEPEEPEEPEVPEQPEDPEDPEGPSEPEPTPPLEEQESPRIKVRAYKTASDNLDLLLEGSTYGLWQVNEGGEDTYLGNQTSNEDGVLLYDLPSTMDATYYLVEETAPYGHLLDPNPTDHFTISADDQGPYLAYASTTEDTRVRPHEELEDETLVFNYHPTNNPVSDDPVRIGIHKRNTATNEHVVGAKLQIVDKETGEVMASWTSSEDEHVHTRTLHTNRTYVLREVNAPDGYQTATEVEFVLHSRDAQTHAEILTGEKTEDGTKNAELLEEDDETPTIILYNEPKKASTPTASTSTPGTGSSATGSTSTDGKGLSTTALPKTGDGTPAMIVAVLIAVGVAFILFARRMR